MTDSGVDRPHERPRFQWTKSWDTLDWQVGEENTRYATYRIGEPDDDDAPLVLAVEYPPGRRYEPHAHDDDYTEFIVAGNLEITRQMHGPGTIRYVQGGTVYGPVVAGPEGAKVLVVFRSRSIVPRYTTPPQPASGGRRAPSVHEHRVHQPGPWCRNPPRGA